MNGPFVVVLRGGVQTYCLYTHFVLLLYFGAGLAWVSVGVHEMWCASVHALVHVHLCA